MKQCHWCYAALWCNVNNFYNFINKMLCYNFTGMENIFNDCCISLSKIKIYIYFEKQKYVVLKLEINIIHPFLELFFFKHDNHILLLKQSQWCLSLVRVITHVDIQTKHWVRLEQQTTFVMYMTNGFARKALVDSFLCMRMILNGIYIYVYSIYIIYMLI